MDITKELEIIDNCAKEYKLNSVFALFSGGHDSLCSTYITAQHPLFKGVIHIDTGIGLLETRQFVQEVCSKFNWELRVYSALQYTKSDGFRMPQNYDNYVKQFGFPGAGNHKIMYSRLKEYPLNQAFRELKKDFKPLAWTTGIRLSESKRRMKNFERSKDKGYDKHRSRVWINPILHWDAEKKHELIEFYGLPKNPVYQYLCKSGECLCGAFAQKGELLMLEKHYPETYKRLDDLYQQVKDIFPWEWDEQPPKGFNFSEVRERYGLGKQFLCHSCNAEFEQLEEQNNKLEE